jgi:hypothetical protein
MCEIHHAECRYDKAPPVSQLVAMAKRLQEAEQALAVMTARVDGRSSESTALQVDAANLVDTAQQSSPRPSPPERSRAPIDRVLSPRETISTEEIPALSRSWENGISGPSQAGRPILTDPAAAELTVHEPSPAMLEPDSSTNASLADDTCISLALHTQESAIWEEFAIGNASVQTGVPRQVIAKLLHIHWTWVGPMFLWIHRSAFIRM